jgi:hypothetical protein
MKNTKLTSVKILENLYERFKLNTVNTKMTLQKLTNRSVDRYKTSKVEESRRKQSKEEKNSTLVRRLENAFWHSYTIKRVCYWNIT